MKKMQSFISSIDITKTLESLDLSESDYDDDESCNESINSDTVPECGSKKETSAQGKTAPQESQVSGVDTVPATKDTTRKLPTYKVVRRPSIDEEPSDFEEYVTEYFFNANAVVKANVNYKQNRIRKELFMDENLASGIEKICPKPNSCPKRRVVLPPEKKKYDGPILMFGKKYMQFCRINLETIDEEPNEENLKVLEEREEMGKRYFEWYRHRVHAGRVEKRRRCLNLKYKKRLLNWPDLFESCSSTEESD